MFLKLQDGTTGKVQRTHSHTQHILIFSLYSMPKVLLEFPLQKNTMTVMGGKRNVEITNEQYEPTFIRLIEEK